MPQKQDFYIGYAKKIPKGWKTFLVLALLLATLGALGYAFFNHLFRTPPHAGVSGKKNVELKGVFLAKPYPMLLVERTFKKVSSAVDKTKGKAISRYYVTPPGKRGLGKGAQKWHKKYVSMKGKLIYREDQTMIVTRGNAIKEIKAPGRVRSILRKSHTKKLGKFTLQGEIVDSKCFLGQMKPGSGKTHRACATLCIRGGLPPLFVVNSSEIRSGRLYLVLTSKSGAPVNQRVLDVVAEPIEITGEITKEDNFYFLKAEPETYRRLSSI